MNDGLNLGTITLCGVCHYAIVLRRFKVDREVYGAREADLWTHMGQSGCGMHDAEEPRFLIPVVTADYTDYLARWTGQR